MFKIKAMSSELSDSIRSKIKLNLQLKLGPNTKADLDLNSLKDLEESIYSFAKSVPLKVQVHTYTSKAKMIYLYLSPDSYIKNEYLLEAIKTNKIDIKDLGSMTESYMNPSKWQGTINKIAEANQVSHGPQVVASDIIKCRCGGQTTFTEQQTRSSDEAMTIKATCLKCGKKFNI